MTEITAAHVVAQYLWFKAKSDLGWSENNYGGMIPFATAGQQQELMSYTGPFVLFSWSPQPEPLWLMDREIAAFTVYSGDTTDVGEFVNMGRGLFKKLDETAWHINNFISSLPSEYAAYKNFDIKSVGFRSATGPQPPMQEGGRFDGNIIVSITYTNLGDTFTYPPRNTTEARATS
jgi:hypothetical protein